MSEQVSLAYPTFSTSSPFQEPDGVESAVHGDKWGKCPVWFGHFIRLIFSMFSMRNGLNGKMDIIPMSPKKEGVTRESADTSSTDEISRIEQALDVLLRAITDAPAPTASGQNLTFLSVDDLAAIAKRSDTGQRADEICDDPIGQALRGAVRDLGRRLNEIGGSELMRQVAERAAEIDGALWSRRADILDKQWDGIGDWVA